MSATLAFCLGRPLLAALAALATLAGAGSATALGQGPSAPRHPDRVALLQAVGEIEDLVQGARFRTAIGVAESTGAWAKELPPAPEVRDARSRLWVLLATAQLALGEDAAARSSMDRALDDRASLELPEDTTSPRVLALLEQARAARAPDAEPGP